MTDISTVWDRIKHRLIVDNTRCSVELNLSIPELVDLKIMIEEIINLEGPS
jgi:hypothetical protein